MSHTDDAQKEPLLSSLYAHPDSPFPHSRSVTYAGRVMEVSMIKFTVSMWLYLGRYFFY